MSGNDQESVLKVLVELVDQVTEPLHRINEHFEEFSETVHGAWYAAAELFAGYEAIKGLVEPAVEMAQAQARIGLAGKFSAEQLAEMKEQAEDLAKSFPTNVDSIVAAQTELYQTFRDMDDVKHGTEVAVKLATVLGTDAAQATRILDSAVQNLGDDTKPLAQQMDTLGDKIAVMRDLFPAGAAGTSRMAIELGKLGIVMHQYGLTQNQVFGLWGELNRLHIGGARGAGQFAEAVIQSLAKVNEQGLSELSKYGVTMAYFDAAHTKLNLIKTLELMSKMSPAALSNISKHLTGPGAALAELAAHFDDVKGAFYDFKGGGGELDKAANVLANTPQARIDRLVNSMQILADQVGTELIPQLNGLVNILSQWVNQINTFMTLHPKWTKALADLAVGFAAVMTAAGAWKFLTILVGLGKLAWQLSQLPVLFEMLGNAGAAASLVLSEGVGSVGAALLMMVESNPIGWLVTALAALAVAGFEVWQNWDKIKSVIVEVADAAKGVIADMQKSGIFQGYWNNFVAAFKPGNDGSFMLAHPRALPYSLNSEHISGASETHLHYSPVINVPGGGTPEATTQALHEALQAHASDLTDWMNDFRRSEDRRSLLDTATPAGAYGK